MFITWLLPLWFPVVITNKSLLTDRALEVEYDKAYSGHGTLFYNLNERLDSNIANNIIEAWLTCNKLHIFQRYKLVTFDIIYTHHTHTHTDTHDHSQDREHSHYTSQILSYPFLVPPYILPHTQWATNLPLLRTSIHFCKWNPVSNQESHTVQTFSQVWQ